MKRDKGYIYPDIKLLRSVVSMNMANYNISDLIKGKMKVDIDDIVRCEEYFSGNLIEKIHFDSLIYLGACLKLKYLMSFTSNNSKGKNSYNNSREDILNYKIALEDIYKLYEVNHLYKLLEEKPDNFKLVSLTWKYTENNILQTIQITTSAVISGLINMYPERFDNRTPLSLLKSIKYYNRKLDGTDETYFKKFTAKSIKFYLDENNIFTKEGVEATSKQLRLISFIMKQFEILNIEKYSDDVNSIRSLLKTPFKF